MQPSPNAEYASAYSVHAVIPLRPAKNKYIQDKHYHVATDVTRIVQSHVTHRHGLAARISTFNCRSRGAAPYWPHRLLKVF